MHIEPMPLWRREEMEEPSGALRVVSVDASDHATLGADGGIKLPPDWLTGTCGAGGGIEASPIFAKAFAHLLESLKPGLDIRLSDRR